MTELIFIVEAIRGADLSGRVGKSPKQQDTSVQLPIRQLGTWFQAHDHIKLPLPLAYHRLEVINNKFYTIGGYSDRAPEGLEAG